MEPTNPNNESPMVPEPRAEILIQETVKSEPKKSFFEKYQLFFALIICGILIAAGLIIATLMRSKSSDGQQATENIPTQSQERKKLIGVATSIGADKSKFEECLDNGTDKQRVTDATTLATNSGVTGTPTFFIVKRTVNSDGTFSHQKQFEILGARDEQTFEQAITNGVPPADQPAQPAGDPIVLSPTDHWQGPRDARVVIVEYADLDCPFCKAERPIINDIIANHPEYALVFRHSPIVSLHPWAEYDAEGSECLFDQTGDEGFWKYVDMVMK